MFQRVLLVAPPSSSYLGAVRPPAGLGYLAQALREVGIECAAEDMRASGRLPSLLRKIGDFQPDLIGFSLVSYEYLRSYELLREVKDAHPQIPIIVGGPHVSVLGQTVLEECAEIDFGIVHEGERPLVQLCQGETPHGQVPGLIYRQNGVLLSGPPAVAVLDLDSISFPRFTEYDRKRYAREINIVTSRGCPYRCIFCPNSLTTRKFRARSAATVVDELAFWFARGIRHFNINDDNFTLVKERVYEICDEIEKRELTGLFIRCANGIRADRVDRPLLARMKEVGFKEVAFGADGGNNRVLKEIVNKGETIEDINQALQDACDLGLKVKLFIIVGHPGETMSDVEDSIALAQRYPIVWLHLNNPIPYPGTRLFDIAKENDYFVIPPEEYLNQTMETGDMPVFATPELPLDVRKELMVRCREIEKDVKRKAVERMFVGLPIFRNITGWLFASNIGQRLFFKNIFVRSIINRIWYWKMMRV